MEIAHRDASQLLETNRDKIRQVAEGLLKYETLDAADVKQIVSGQPLSKPTVTELLERERTKTGTRGQAAKPGAKPATGADSVPQPG